MVRAWYGLTLSAIVWFSVISSGFARECGCDPPVAADSFADSGECVVVQGSSGYCTLDWRHGAGTVVTDPEATDRAESGAIAIQQFALGGFLPAENLFANAATWDELGSYAKDVDLLYRQAATYLEQTPPDKYERDLVLGSILALIGSATIPQDKDTNALVLGYVANNADAVFAVLSGDAAPDPAPHETPWGMISDMSSTGCFEVRRVRKDAPDEFDLRVAVKTGYAVAGAGCLPR